MRRLGSAKESCTGTDCCARASASRKRRRCRNAVRSRSVKRGTLSEESLGVADKVEYLCLPNLNVQVKRPLFFRPDNRHFPCRTRLASSTRCVSRLICGQRGSRSPESTSREKSWNMADSWEPGALLLGSSIV